MIISFTTQSVWLCMSSHVLCMGGLPLSFTCIVPTWVVSTNTYLVYACKHKTLPPAEYQQTPCDHCAGELRAHLFCLCFPFPSVCASRHLLSESKRTSPLDKHTTTCGSGPTSGKLLSRKAELQFAPNCTFTWRKEVHHTWTIGRMNIY